ncbi:MAG: prolipoprotein diacylglyceryl transferase [Lachnospiraceae bacterium]|nr:prolipoprotein diacylglyceryl transferase [Lachnospiraceae bacterium]
MYPYLNIFGKTFSSYGVFALIGLAAAVLYSFIVHKVTHDQKDFFSRFIYIVYCGAFGGITAAILYQLTNIKYIIQGLPYLFSDFEKFKTYMSFGIVFYGGMIGIFIGFMVYSQYFKEDTRMWLMTSVPGIPLFHAFGRVGCTVGGCCYGLPHAHVGVFNKESGIFDIGDNPVFQKFSVYNARTGSYHLPIQLIESAGLIIIFIILVIFLVAIYRKKAYYKTMGLYFVLYGVLRFVDEFFRGDTIRGIWGPFSTSQYISMIIVPLGIYCLICPTEKNFFEKWYKPKKEGSNVLS